MLSHDCAAVEMKLSSLCPVSDSCLIVLLYASLTQICDDCGAHCLLLRMIVYEMRDCIGEAERGLALRDWTPGRDRGHWWTGAGTAGQGATWCTHRRHRIVAPGLGTGPCQQRRRRGTSALRRPSAARQAPGPSPGPEAGDCHRDED